MIELLDYPDHPIRMHVTSEAERTMRIHSCKKESETIDFLESGMGVFYDIGANTGAYSLVASAMGYRVVAFEPAEANVERLRANCELNPDLEVTVVDMLLTDHDGTENFAYSSLEPGAALHRTGFECGLKVEKQLCMNLDTARYFYDLPQPDLIKIDTDGAEYSILLGATDTLKGVSALQVEEPKEGNCAIREFLTQRGFQLSSVHPHSWSDIANVVYRRV